MHEMGNPSKETNFENCLADVNIPVGEVFTSPKLTGTNGVLHVGEVYLNDLKFVDLEITFKDGMISEYTCKNFETEKKIKHLLKKICYITEIRFQWVSLRLERIQQPM